MTTLVDGIKQGQDVVKAVDGFYDALQGLYSKLSGTNNFKDRTRSLELLMVNGSTRKLVWAAPYFDSGTTFSGPDPMNIEPGQSSLWLVTSSAGGWATGVTGGGKWNIEGTDKSVVIGFCNPFAGSYKNVIGIRAWNEDQRWGYDNSQDEQAKQSTDSGFYVRVYMNESKLSPFRRFVYCIADA
jgi:hypothetical protein